MICKECRNANHKTCYGRLQCDCQHRSGKWSVKKDGQEVEGSSP
jgi:hypothetical protein